MAVSKSRAQVDVPWLLLTFTLSVKRASQRVEVWRNLQRYGSVPLGNSGYLLPNNPINQERIEWLAQAIRKYDGEASVISVRSIDNLSIRQLEERFMKRWSGSWDMRIGTSFLAHIQRKEGIYDAKNSTG